VKDLAENGIEIELMHIGSSFDVSAFYKVSGQGMLYEFLAVYNKISEYQCWCVHVCTFTECNITGRHAV